MGLDPTTRRIYLPTSEFEEPQPGARGPAMKPDTFMIIVVARRAGE